jgi:hypothetical protein
MLWARCVCGPAAGPTGTVHRSLRTTTGLRRAARASLSAATHADG